jgi:N,N'-diacetyllegionaminate synthase
VEVLTAPSTFSRQFSIAGRPIGQEHPVYVIAEAGVAHFGDERKAHALVDLAIDAGADAVKFQIFDVDALIASALPDWRARLASRQLPYEAFRRLQAYCRTRRITFLATAHDEPSFEFLRELDVPAFKVGSGEVGNWSFLARIASARRPMILSTGMYARHQIVEALEAIATAGQSDVALLHCVTSYPTAPPEAYLGTMAELRKLFGGVIGYSDHTRGFHIPLAAVALGARIVEKHITLDFDVPNAQDWKVSCGPHDFGQFIRELRDVEAALAARVAPTDAERESLIWASKSLVTVRDISPGTLVTADDLVAKRPGTGIAPGRAGEVVGRSAAVLIPRDTVVQWEHLK